jgi:rRNA-processing protein FCF1
MNGNRVLLDTNAIAALLQGNLDLVELLKSAE